MATEEKKGGKMGRPHTFTREKETKLCDLLAGGNTRRAACAGVGISEDTLAAWLARSEKGDADFIGLSDRVKEAEASAEPALVAVLWKAATGYEKRRTKVKRKSVLGPKGIPITGPDGKLIFYEEQEIETERTFDWRAALEILKRRFGDTWGDSLQLRGASDDDLLELAEKLGLAGAELAGAEDPGDEPEEGEGVE